MMPDNVVHCVHNKKEPFPSGKEFQGMLPPLGERLCPTVAPVYMSFSAGVKQKEGLGKHGKTAFRPYCRCTLSTCSAVFTWRLRKLNSTTTFSWPEKE